MDGQGFRGNIVTRSFSTYLKEGILKNIIYLKNGNAVVPVSTNSDRVIIHCCNDIGLWGAGFVVALSAKWPRVKEEYIKWSKQPTFKLGEVQFVKVEKDVTIGNMIGQKGVANQGNIRPIRYDAIDQCLKKVRDYCIKNTCTVHCPKFGAELAGGEWSKIEQLIINNLSNNGIQVFVYCFE